MHGSDGRMIPKGMAPVLPVLSLGSFTGEGHGRIPSVLDAGFVQHVTAGRMAIRLALDDAGIGPGDRVLLPAYHCAAMVEPVLSVSATPVFYRIMEDTRADLDDISDKISDQTRALLIVHYFGFPQPVKEIREYCNEKGIILIEDCAHCLFGENDGRPVGATGDYAIASLMKFFPIFDGGCLISPRARVDRIPVTPAGMATTLKATSNILERAADYGRFGVLLPAVRSGLWLKNLVWRRVRQQLSPEQVAGFTPAAADGGSGRPGEFEENWVNVQMSGASRLIARLASSSRIVTRRRKYFLRLLDAFSSVPGCRPLFRALPEGVVPYMFPMLLDGIERVFPALEDEGVPMLRFGQFPWPGAEDSNCSVSNGFSQRLVQLPCHQELKEIELEWIVERVLTTMRDRAK